MCSQVEFELKNIERKVEVKRVELGQAPPTDGSYWWDSGAWLLVYSSPVSSSCYLLLLPRD